MSIRILVLLSLVAAVVWTTGAEAAAQTRPNIVIILGDDFGVGDIQAHFPKNKIPTPFLDRFTNESMRFTNAHSGSAVCTPTRYGLLTGRYAWRTRLQEWVLACYEPPLIAADRLTLPRFLKQHGYATACIGKWHLGWNWAGPQPSTMEVEQNIHRKKQWDYTQSIQDGPTTRGFDYYFGTHVPNFPPFTFIENDRVVEQPVARFVHQDDGMSLPAMFEGSPMAPGWRFDQILPKITQRAVDYIHQQAKLEKPFFLYFAMTSPHTPIAPNEAFKGKSGIAPIADFIMQTDWSAGQVIQALQDAGVAKNTLVIFTTDNGHPPQGWKELVDAGHSPSGPYRGRKGDIWEGGHRVPFLVRWPGHVPAGKSTDQVLCLNDVFATCAEILGARLPDDAAQDSFSFLPAILGKSPQPHRDHVIHHSVGGEFGFREGPWKLVFKNQSANVNQSRGKPRVVELYNVEEDIGETKDLAGREPQRVRELSERLRQLIARGSSRPGARGANDAEVVVDSTQRLRWAEARKTR
jgi:arylsulfatase A-like enzyme